MLFLGHGNRPDVVILKLLDIEIEIGLECINGL